MCNLVKKQVFDFNNKIYLLINLCVELNAMGVISRHIESLRAKTELIN